jgi:PAS domain S-box-containing protein
MTKLTDLKSIELTFAQELRLLHGSGVWRWYVVRGAVARTLDGRVSRVVGSLTDVNERKLREVELADARQHLSDALESLDVGLIMYDARQRYLLSNGRMQELFGLDEFDLEVGQSIETSLRRHLALHPELLGNTHMDERIDALMALYAPRGGRQELQIGGRWFRFQDYPTAAGGVVSLRAEMTAFKHAEQALHESEARLRTIFEHAPVGIFLTDSEGLLRYGNPVFAEVLGAADVSSPLFDWRLCVHPEDRQRMEAAWFSYVREPHGELELECRIVRAGASVALALFRANPVLEQGELLGFAGTLEDITERRDAESRQRQLQGQLQQAQKMDAIGQLTGGIAHDFNNILAGILGYTTLAQMRPAVAGDAKLREYLSAVEVAGERARDLVAKMLAFSRTKPQDKETIKLADPGPMLNEVVTLLRAIIPSNKQLIAAIEPDLPPIRMAPVDLHQVVINLAINARDAITGNGVITLAAIPPRRVTGVCASCHGAFDGEFMEIAVKDTGSGISPEHVEHLFEPFFTTKEVGKGTGMGLAVTHGVIHSIQGHLLVDSTPGVGTSFRLLLRPEPAGVPTPLVVCTGPDNTGATPMPVLLVVNSEVDLARQQAASLAGYGYRVAAFAEAKAALQWTREHHQTCDALVLDLHGPEMTPIEFTNQVLALRPYLPVLLCARPEDRIDPRVATALGIAQVLETPVMPDRLHRILQQILGQSDQRQGVA